MEKIAILGDTSQDLDFNLAKQFHIELLPYYISMDETSVKDLVDIDKETFFRTMDDYEEVKSGVPSANDVLEILSRLEEEGYTDVIMMTSTVKLTGMHALYYSLLQMDPVLKLHIIDTGTVASSAGLLVIEAAKLRDQGLDVNSILNRIHELKEKTRVRAAFQTLKYVVKGGRLGKLAGAVGSLLNINPLLTIEDNEIAITDKARGAKKGLKLLADHLREDLEGVKNYHIVTFHGDSQQEYDLFKKENQEIINQANLAIESRLASVLGVYTGPKVVGYSILTLDD